MHMGIGSKLTEATQLCSPSHVDEYLKNWIASFLCTLPEFS